MNLSRADKFICLGALAAIMSGGEAMAQGLGFTKPVTPIMHDIVNFHDKILLPIIILTSLFVLALLVWVILRFNAKANPVPATFTHNSTIEIIWTAVPVLILIFIAIFSFPLLYKEDVVPSKVDLTIKAIGHQWYWEYEYPDIEGLSVTANMLETREAAKAAGKPYLLGTDNAVVVPVNKVVRIQTTAADVIHSWAMPQFGVKIDAVPGRLNEEWFKAEETGTFYGQCSEVCGIKHFAMPIEIKVVTQQEFDAWVASQKSASLNSIQFAAK
jgi:cytochrome c oxidase subunit II